MGYAKRSVGTQSADAARVKTGPSLRSDGKRAKPSGSSIWNMQIGGAKQKTDMKRIEVLLFVSELADLLEAGMTLGQALQALASQGEAASAQRFVCQDLCDRIVRG